MADSRSISRPETVDGRLFSSNVGAFTVIHALALLALIPYLFSWTGVALVFVGNFVFGGLGINVGYHRLLTHHGFRCPKWLEHTFALLGVCCLQDSPTRWVAIHRIHHQHTDKRPDPHSPLVSFSWSWMGWLVFKNRHLRKRSTLAKYTKDLAQDPFYEWLHRHRRWLYIYAAHAILFLLAGYVAGWLLTGTPGGALQFGLSVLVWGVFVRTVYVWHVTWTANAMAHRWGYRNYETGENSRNNWLVSLLSNGEGWHNNHHAHPRSARHGERWWEVDMIYATIAMLRIVGLVTDVVTTPLPEQLGSKTAFRHPARGVESHDSSRPRRGRPAAIAAEPPDDCELTANDAAGDAIDHPRHPTRHERSDDRIDTGHAFRPPSPHVPAAPPRTSTSIEHGPTDGHPRGELSQ